MSDRRKPETVLSAAIQEALTGLGYLVTRIQSGKFKVNGGWAYGARKGTPDLHVCGRGNVSGFIEVKTADGKLSEDQIVWRKQAEALGVNVGEARSVREAVEVVRGWGEVRR